MTIQLQLIALIGAVMFTNFAQAVQVRNSSFSEARGTTIDAKYVAKLRAKGWKCPDAKDWPHSWSGHGAKVIVQFPLTGGRKNDAFCRISGGTHGYVAGYWGFHFKSSQVLTFWARGKGVLRVGLMAYKLSADRKRILPGGRMPTLDIEVNSKTWQRYRYLMRKPAYELTGHPMFLVPKGVVDIDDVDILDSNPAFDAVVAEENKLYGKKALVESLDRVQVDKEFAARLKLYRSAVKNFEQRSKSVSAHLLKPLQKRVVSLRQYVEPKKLRTVQAIHYNDMLVLTRVLNRAAGLRVGNARVVTTTKLSQSKKPYYAGKRLPRPSKLTITNVRSDKVRYNELENASTVATVVNHTAKTIRGKLQARLVVDLKHRRNIGSTAFTIASGQTKKWTIKYNVGPETYGRAVEVDFINDKGKLLDRWQEYYVVAREFFRVHQHSYQTKRKYFVEDPRVFYFNQTHYFAHEPTGLGAEPFKAEIYISGQAGYRINQVFRKAQIAVNKLHGIISTFYVIGSFDGQMGYELARRHPEFLLYDRNGQPAKDPLYGGFPNPMELASPLEVGPKRKKMKIKKHLDRIYRPWQHINMNMAREDAVVWAVKRMKVYAKEWGFGGVYWDGCLGVWAGLNHEGKPNVASGKYEDFVKLSARNHRIFNRILKKDNPNFGTWMNWGLEGATGEFAKRHGITIWLGSGVKGDPLDDNIRAATNARNVMLLDEHQNFTGEIYAKLLRDRIRSRDHYVQKYGASHTIGYANPAVDLEEPGATKWGWPAWNHAMSLLIATQSHLCSSFVPSQRPGLQFMSRYSRFIWARDIKTVPVTDAKRMIKVSSPDKLWWPRLVYRRKVSGGYDLIVHLLRVPATKKVDYQWADEPSILKRVRVSVDVPDGNIQFADACRAYFYDEPQQVVHQSMLLEASKKRVVMTVPPFRYHTMLVIRVKNKE